MQQNISVTVSHRVAIVRNIDAAQPQRPAVFQPMRIMTDADAKRGGGLLLILAQFAARRS